MRIGLDAKRAFHNHSGLGNYSRTLIRSLAAAYPMNQYLLFNPKPSSLFTIPPSCIEINPTNWPHTILHAWWRSRWMVDEIAQRCEVYHGLSHELPFGSEKLSIPKLVTIHDLIFEQYPEQYRRSDVLIYRKKFQYACEVANLVIAISEATKNDIIQHYHVPKEKIITCYQAIDERFFTEANEAMKKEVQIRYALPDKFLLSVGSIIERKNLWRVCEALECTALPLVVVGKGGRYKQQLQDFLKKKNMDQRVLFLEDRFTSGDLYRDLPILYQLAFIHLYPSIMEGFGLPVIEAMASGVPVITSDVSSLKEIGEKAALLVNPLKTEAIAQAIQQLENENDLYQQYVERGRTYAQQFKPVLRAHHMMQIYESVINKKTTL